MEKPVKPLRLAVFDMDGVLVDVESSWMFVHEAFKVDNEDNYRRYFSGEIGYQEFLDSDIRLWGRVPLAKIEEILAKVPLMPGARETIETLKGKGFLTAIISSGLEPLALRLKRQLGLDYVYANRLIVDGEGYLTGKGESVVEPKRKLEVLERLTEQLGLKPCNCAVVGDSFYDAPMLKAAGLGIAFNPKDEVVERAADVVVRGKNLKAVLKPILERA
ncbi:MAG: phosphoserine phosphatase [Candidatus Hecatellales archaeon]|nr:MAG: phosphoserine phosphatase [Candidatus Hecatellales archaeon]